MRCEKGGKRDGERGPFGVMRSTMTGEGCRGGLEGGGGVDG